MAARILHSNAGAAAIGSPSQSNRKLPTSVLNCAIYFGAGGQGAVLAWVSSAASSGCAMRAAQAWPIPSSAAAASASGPGRRGWDGVSGECEPDAEREDQGGDGKPDIAGVEAGRRAPGEQPRLGRRTRREGPCSCAPRAGWWVAGAACPREPSRLVGAARRRGRHPADHGGRRLAIEILQHHDLPAVGGHAVGARDGVRCVVPALDDHVGQEPAVEPLAASPR